MITTIVTNIRNRKQPVLYQYGVVTVFKGEMLGTSNVTASLFLSSPEDGYGDNVPNLSIVTLEVSNGGNRDMSAFDFGLTLPDDEKVVACNLQSADRHHVAQQVNPLGLGTPSSTVDFRVSPFNRRDTYTFTLYVICTGITDVPKEIALSSKEAVIFRNGKKIPTLVIGATELLLKTYGIR